MTLYTTSGHRGRTRSSLTIWNGDRDVPPKYSTTKEEIRPFKPTPGYCQNVGCTKFQHQCIGVLDIASGRYFRWCSYKLCLRCSLLWRRHHLTLENLVDIWIHQNKQCLVCPRVLPDPRSDLDWQKFAHIDHDHEVCPQENHSCHKCRRGWACATCNKCDRATNPTIQLNNIYNRDIAFWLKFTETDDAAKAAQLLHEAADWLSSSAQAQAQAQPQPQAPA